MLHAVPWEPAHMLILETNGFENPKLKTDLAAVLVAGRGYALSMFDASYLICIVGYVHVFEQNVEVFLIPSVFVKDRPVTVVRECIRFLQSLEKQFRRIQTLAVANDEHDDWMRALGFINEGTLVKYTDAGLDYRQWARVRHE